MKIKIKTKIKFQEQMLSCMRIAYIEIEEFNFFFQFVSHTKRKNANHIMF